MELIDRETGKAVEVPDEHASAAYQSGRYGVRGQKIDVAKPDGTVGTVAPKDLGTALAGGYSLVPPAKAQELRLQKKYGQIGGQAIAGAEALARGASVGLSDTLAVEGAGILGGTEAKEAVRQHLQNYKEANPTLALGAELGGAVLPAVLTGGESAVAEGAELGKAASLANDAKALGGGVEAAEGLKAGAEGVQTVEAAKGLGTGAKALDGVKAGVNVVSAPSRAVSAAGDLAEEMTKSVLGGTGNTAVGRIVAKGLSGAARGVTEGALYSVGSELSEDELGNHEVTGEKLLAAAGHGALFGGLLGGGLGAGGEAISSAASSLANKLAPSLQKAAEEQAWRAFNPLKKANELADRIPGGTRGLGRTALDYGLVKAGDDLAAIAEKTQAARQQIGEQLSKGYPALDAAGVKAPELEAIEKRALDSLPSSGILKETLAGSRKYAETVIADLRAHAAEQGHTFEALNDFRKAIDDRINFERSNSFGGAPSNPNQDVLKAIRSSIQDELSEAGDKGSSKLGKDWLAENKQLRLDYRRVATLDQAAQKALAAKTANRAISLTDYMAGGAGGLGALTGHPLGVLASTGTALAHKMIRERGNAVAAEMLDKISSLSAMSRATNTLDAKVDAAVGRFAKGERPPALPAKSVSADYDALVQRVRTANTDKVGHNDAVGRYLSSAAGHAPGVAAAFGKSASRATTYLAAQVPKGQATYDDLQPHLVRPRVSDAEKMSFVRKVKAVDDPTSVLDDMAHGRATKDQVDALKEVYPNLYQQMVSKALEAVADKDKPLTYAQKLQLHTLLGIPADKTLDPAFVSDMQKSFGGAPGAGQSGPDSGNVHPAAPKRPLTVFASGAGLKTR